MSARLFSGVRGSSFRRLFKPKSDSLPTPRHSQLCLVSNRKIVLKVKLKIPDLACELRAPASRRIARKYLLLRYFIETFVHRIG
jgi:hypothetical protein